ncbi:MAG: hypothetical protein GXO72_00785, partial [Caldiserica bacterium]|nr:hypothetical protein [Caldisericota bacterium]
MYRIVVSGLVWAALGLLSHAAEWTIQTAPCCYFIVPDGYTISPFAVARLYRRVLDLWDVEIPVAGGAPAAGAVAEGGRLRVAAGGRIGVAIYPDPETFGSEVLYAVAGRFYARPPWDANPLPSPLRTLEGEGLRGAITGYMAICCAGPSWPDVFAHELVHYMQYILGITEVLKGEVGGLGIAPA